MKVYTVISFVKQKTYYISITSFNFEVSGEIRSQEFKNSLCALQECFDLCSQWFDMTWTFNSKNEITCSKLTKTLGQSPKYVPSLQWRYTAQKTKFFNKDIFSKCDYIHKKLRNWSHLLKKSLMENFIFCAVIATRHQVISFCCTEANLEPCERSKRSFLWKRLTANS